MDDVIDYAELVRLVEAGVEQTARALANEHASKPLIGYALLTDDEVSTLAHAACMAEHAPSGVGDIRFQPVEWSLSAGNEPLEPAYELLVRRAQLDGEDGHHTQSDRAFECLIEALARARARGVFAGNVFLSVLSTDPHPEMERLEHAGILRLNSPAVVCEWRRFRLREAEQVLASIQLRPKPWSYAMSDMERELLEEIARLEAELAETRT